jgi:hypothetical protein
MAAIPELLEPAASATPATPSPSAPPLSSTPTPAPIIPVPTLAPPPVRAPEVEVEAHTMTATPTSEPLFTIKVWQLGFAVIAVMLALLYALGIL